MPAFETTVVEALSCVLGNMAEFRLDEVVVTEVDILRIPLSKSKSNFYYALVFRTKISTIYEHSKTCLEPPYKKDK